MKINNVQIEHFGKFENYCLDFEKGFNIIYGNNEDGKSTIMAFIKLMFYGTPGRSSDLSKNMRKKYMPWDGAKISGSIEFEDKGIIYRLEKQFGASNATDRISLWNKATGEKEGIASGTDIGKQFFGIGAAAFEKSVFIGQAGSLADTVDREDEITQKLLNLVSTGDESISQKKVEGRLQKAMELLKSKSGKIGVLDKYYQEMDSLNEARFTAVDEEKNKKQLEQQLAELARIKSTLEENYSKQQSKYDLQQRLIQLDILEKLIEKKQGIDSLITEYKSKELELILGDTAFDAAFVKKCEEQISQIKSLREIYIERKRDVDVIEKENLESKEQNIPEIPEGLLEQLKTKENELNRTRTLIVELKEYISKLKTASKKQEELLKIEQQLSVQINEKIKQESELHACRDKLKTAQVSLSASKDSLDNKNKELSQLTTYKADANTSYQIAINDKKSLEQLSNEKIEMAREQIKQASTSRQVVTSEDAGRSINKPMLIVSIIVVILSIILGIIVSPIYFIAVVIAMVLGVMAFGKRTTKSVIRTIVDETELAKAKENFDNVQKSATINYEIALKSEKAADESLQYFKSQCESLQNTVSELGELYKITSDSVSHMVQKEKEIIISLKFIDEKVIELTQKLKTKQEEKDELHVIKEESDIDILELQFAAKINYETKLSHEILEKLSRKGCQTIDELQNQFNQMQKYKTKRDEKEENFNKAKEAEKQAEENLSTVIEKFRVLVSQYKISDSYEIAFDNLQDLKKAIEEINRLQVQIETQLDFLDRETKARDITSMLEEADNIRKQILIDNDGVIPEKNESLENEQLKQQNKSKFLELQEVREDFIKFNANIKNQFIGKKKVSEIEEAINQLKREIEESEGNYECLTIAKLTLTEAFTEIRQSFGPFLNDKTAAIFNNLTGGKYNNVIISRKFDINVQERQNSVSHEWQYLSSGTIDQAYLSLRFAVAELLSQENESLPLMLDDVFLQYDDKRAEEGLGFLMNFAKQKKALTQIIFFTCHKNILDLAKKNDIDTVIKTIC